MNTRTTLLALILIAGAAGAQLNILNFHDTDATAPGGTPTFTPNFVRDAATALGANLTVVATSAAFQTTFDTMFMGGNLDVVIVSVWTNGGSAFGPVLDRLVAFDAAGGHTIMNSWSINSYSGHAYCTTTVPVTFTGTYSSPVILHSWNPAHPIWTTPNAVASPVAIGTIYASWGVDGQYCNAGPGATAVGGYNGATPTPTNGGILIGPNGSIFNSFTPQQYNMASMVNLLINEIMFNVSSTECTISAPVAAATVSGPVTVTFDGDDTEMDVIDSALEFSTDGGTTWAPATVTPTSPLTNPDLARATPFTGVSFEWNSPADAVGLAMVEAAELRILVTDGTNNGSCTVSVMVDNVIPPPSCVLTLPAGTLRGDVAMSAATASPNAPTVNVLFEYSLDNGVTWTTCTAAATSAIPNPAAGVPVGPADFVWDSRADNIGLAAIAPGVFIRATVDDLVSFLTGSCSDVRDVDNTQICFGICGDCSLNAAGPDILDALAAAQVAAGLIVPTVVQTACCDVNVSGAVTIVDALLIAQVAAGLPVTLMCA